MAAHIGNLLALISVYVCGGGDGGGAWKDECVTQIYAATCLMEEWPDIINHKPIR